MSKGLEALEKLKTETIKGGTSYIGKHFKRHYHRIIEKELKALEIIKENSEGIVWKTECNKEDIDFVKEVLL